MITLTGVDRELINSLYFIANTSPLTKHIAIKLKPFVSNFYKSKIRVSNNMIIHTCDLEKLTTLPDKIEIYKNDSEFNIKLITIDFLRLFHMTGKVSGLNSSIRNPLNTFWGIMDRRFFGKRDFNMWHIDGYACEIL